MGRFEFNYPRLVLAVLTVVTVIAIVVAASTSSAAFGSYNDAWDGASELREQARAVDTESELVRNTSRYTTVAPNGTLGVVLSPESAYGPAETDRLRSFVRDGGTLLVAEDFGQHANGLLDRLGADARVTGQVLRDEQYNYQSPALPVARNVSNHTLTQGVDGITLNYGSAVAPNGARVLASTSGVAYVDVNRNAELDDRDRVGTSPVATIESVGDGRVVVVGDPSLFINTMLDRPGNQAFVGSLFGSHQRVLLDYSHAGRLPPLSVALLVVRDTPLIQGVLGVVGITIIGFVARRPDVLRRARDRIGPNENGSPTPGSAALSSFVHERHPDWDDERVDRVIQGIMARRDE